MYRSIKECYDLLKKSDNDTAITPYFLRNLAKRKCIKIMSSGNKVLIDFNSLQEYLEKGE